MTETKLKITMKEIISTLAHQGYKFKLSVLDDRVHANDEPITDLKWAEIRTQMRDRGFKNTYQVMDAVTYEATKHPFHPVKDYLQSLMGWDGTPYIDKLASYFTDKDGAFPFLLPKWMIGAIAKVYTKGEAQNPMWVLDGKQNIGKSSFVKWLAGEPLRNYFIEEAIDPENKDHSVYLIMKWIWEVMELGSTLKRADFEALKRFQTQRQVTVRKPYGREPMIKPAMASFIGTTNNISGFLVDATGHRRYRPCEITKINWNYATEVYQGDVWAEAYTRYLMGETFELTPDEMKIMEPIYERYEVTDPMMECLLKHFHIDPLDMTSWMSTYDILYHLEKNHFLKVNLAGRADAMYLATAATRLKLRKAKQGTLNGYYGIRVKP